MEQQQMPDPTEYKKQQTSLLATMVPQIMNAMGGGDPYVQRALQQQKQEYEGRIMQNNLRGFMRTISMPATGQITPELIMEQAQVWDVPPDVAMQAVTQFQQFRKANQAEKQKFSRVLPGGGVNTFEALPTDPMAQGEGVFPGELSNMPGPPALTETHNPDGTVTIVPKVPGAKITPKPDKPNLVQIDTGDGGKRFVVPREGMAYRENQKSPVATVNVNNMPPAPKGYRYAEDQRTLEPIPGGPVDAENKGQAKKEIKTRVLRQIQADTVNNKIDEALEGVDKWTTGVPGVVSGMVPGTKSHDLQNTLNTVKANIGFDKLQSMRNASPTGGALGQVSEMENKLLQQTFGSVEQSQSAEQLRKNLIELQKVYNRIVHGEEAVDMIDITVDMSKKSNEELLKMIGQ